MISQLLSDGLRESSLNLCKSIAGSREVVAACFYGSHVGGYADKKSDVNILLVLNGQRPALTSFFKSPNGVSVFFLVVDRGAFERDVERGWLGEFLAEKIALPYEPLVNEDYLHRLEVKLKRRFIWEILENIVSEFPELSQELLIEPEYFLYETLMRRARLFPPITYSFLNMLRGNLRAKNVELMMKGYLEALKELAEEDWVIFSNGYVKVTEGFVDDAKKRRRLQAPSFFRSIQRAVSLYVFSFFPTMMRPLLQSQETYAKFVREVKAEESILQLEDPKKYLFIQTPLGSVTLSDKTTIEDFVGKAVPNGKISDLKIEELGGVLNAVYLLTFQRDHEEQKVVVKKFKDWLDFKWFPLALWTLGTRSFTVLGRSRLEREYAVNRFLHNHGFPVPRVLYVSLKERLIFEDFVEGENMTKIVKRIISAKQAPLQDASLIREVGRKIAEAHKLGVALGDCKPENIIFAEDGKAYFVDLEQATRNENQAWDIAELLYYSGHYVSPIASAEPAELIARELIRGYLDAGGKRETVKEAGSVRYAKVFSIFTPPHVILAISNICRKMGEN